MGAIRMDLERLQPPDSCADSRNEVPLGRILRARAADFRSEAKVYLALTPNSEMMGVFWMREPRTLYGRQTEVLYRGQHIGDIVEVLPLV